MSFNKDKILNALKDTLGEEAYEKLIAAFSSMDVFQMAKACAMEANAEFSSVLYPLGFAYNNVYEVECLGPDGELKWEDKVYNLVVNEGLTHTLDVIFGNTAKVVHDSWYLGLTGTTPTFLAGSTLSAIPGTEVTTAVDASGRLAIPFPTTSTSQSITSESAVSFGVDQAGPTTVGGAFITDVQSGTAGILYGGNEFSGGDKSVDNGDTLNVNVTINATSTP